LPPDTRELVLVRERDAGVSAKRGFECPSKSEGKMIRGRRDRQSMLGGSLPMHDPNERIEIRRPLGLVAEHPFDLGKVTFEKCAVEVDEPAGQTVVLLTARRTGRRSTGFHIAANLVSMSGVLPELGLVRRIPPSFGPHRSATPAVSWLRSASKRAMSPAIVVDSLRDRHIRVSLAASHGILP
jgi:hypothetical protein